MSDSADEKVIYVSGCVGPCGPGPCICVENLERVIASNPWVKVEFRPSNDPVFRNFPVSNRHEEP